MRAASACSRIFGRVSASRSSIAASPYNAGMRRSHFTIGQGSLTLRVGIQAGVVETGGVENETNTSPAASPVVGVVMGSQSDWETMRHAHETLDRLGVPHECRIVSAHRTPDVMTEYAKTAELRGIEVIIAGAGGAAHLPGMLAASTIVPVLGVPVESHALKGMDSLLSIVQMPGGIPVGTLAIGRAGAINAALLAVAILGNSRPELRAVLHRFRQEQTEKVRADTLPI